jgi:hypothetical protein
VVFVVTGDRVERRGVALGATMGANRVVTTGLKDGDRVVLSPPDSLQHGDAVTLARN